MEISEIPIGELLNDLCESAADARSCEIGMAYGVTTLHGKSATERRAKNLEFISTISTEIKRRITQNEQHH